MGVGAAVHLRGLQSPPVLVHQHVNPVPRDHWTRQSSRRENPPGPGFFGFYQPRFPPGYGHDQGVSIGRGGAPAAGGTLPDIASIDATLASGQRGARIIWPSGDDLFSTLTLFGVGLSSTSWHGRPLPLDPTLMGASNCVVYFSFD